MKRSKAVALLSGILIFALGIALGFMSHRFYETRTVNAAEDWRVKYVKDMHERLKLDAHQVDKLNDILDGTRTDVRAVRERYKPEMLQIKEKQIADIRTILNPAQTSLYAKMVSEQENKARDQENKDRQAELERRADRERRQVGHPN